MKLYSFRAEGRTTIGAQLKNYLVDLPAAYALFQQLKGPLEVPRLPSDMMRFLAGGQVAMKLAADTLSFAAKRPPIPVGERIYYGLDEVELLPPIARPWKILILEDYQNESALNALLKVPSSVIGTGMSIVLPFNLQTVVCGVHLALVIAEKTRNAKEGEASDRIAGYTLLNDVHLAGILNFFGRNMDTFCPLGPCIVTPDSILDWSQVSFRLSVNGELRHEAFAAERGAVGPRIVSMLSQTMTLEPGDIIATGVIAAFNEGLKPGDVVCAEAAPIGSLQNSVSAAPQA